MGKLSTHVLDTMHGRPAQGVQIDLFTVEDSTRTLLKSVTTNEDGRCDGPLLEGSELRRGKYELVFHAGKYFQGMDLDAPEPRFVDEVIVRFGLAAPEQNYHVPLLLTPWSWSTYRGS